MPFCAFFGGYYSLYYWYPIARVTVPSVIGLPLAQACIKLSQANLSPRIVHTLIDAEMPADTVIRQMPEPGISVKSLQTIDLILAQPPANQEAPDYCMMSLSAIEKDMQNKSIKYKHFYVPSSYPQAVCIGQWPTPSMPLPDHRMIIYSSYSTTAEPVIVPDVRGLTLHELQQLCLHYGLPEPVVHLTTTSQEGAGKIIDQRPLPGSIMQLSTISFTCLCGT